jgi:hypothetical protein
MYYFGDGVPKDYKEAVKWYTKAAEQGDKSAQFELGKMYYFGSDVFEGVPQDNKEAVKWFTKASEQGNASAQLELGEMYCDGMNYDGEGVPQDYNEAYKWALLAEMNGENSTTLKERLAHKMTPTQIAEANKVAREFTEKQEKEKTGKDTKASGMK